MECPTCKHDVHPVHEMGGNRAMVRRCPRGECMAAIAEDKPEPRAPEVVSVPTLTVVGGKGSGLSGVEQAFVQVGKQISSIAYTGDEDSPDATAIVEIARARLEWVDAELERLDALQGERATLLRMIGDTE